MTTDKKNQYLVTADVDGVIKVWDILEYCTSPTEDYITEAPRMYHRMIYVYLCISLLLSHRQLTTKLYKEVDRIRIIFDINI